MAENVAEGILRKLMADGVHSTGYVEVWPNAFQLDANVKVTDEEEVYLHRLAVEVRDAGPPEDQQ